MVIREKKHIHCHCYFNKKKRRASLISVEKFFFFFGNTMLFLYCLIIVMVMQDLALSWDDLLQFSVLFCITESSLHWQYLYAFCCVYVFVREPSYRNRTIFWQVQAKGTRKTWSSCTLSKTNTFKFPIWTYSR